MNKIKKEKGITLVALVTTIILILILASIAVTGGSEIIKKANLENLKTNLLLVEAKAKEALEQAVHEWGVNKDRVDEAEKKLIGDKDIDPTILSTIGASENEAEQKYLRKFEAEQLKEEMGIDGLEGTIVIEYDLENVKVEVYSSKGFVDNGNTKYSLTDIQEIKL